MRIHRNGRLQNVLCFSFFACLFVFWSPQLKQAKAEFPTKRIPVTSSNVIGSPEPPKPYRLKRFYNQLDLGSPVHMIPEPGTNRVFIAEYHGNILSFEEGSTSGEMTTILDLAHSLYDRRPYNLVFHPNYLENRRLYIILETKNLKGERDERIEVYEFLMGDDGNIDPASEKLIITWASSGHAGGGICFANDGLLYITTGDGTTGGDTNNTGQDITDLQAAVLRIDVDHPAPGMNYSIPKDNPFLDIADARHEIYAFGVRAPWRMTHDKETDQIWIGDVGQDVWEMIRLLKKGANYGWSITEGGLPFQPERKQGPGELVPPTVKHHHTEARSITGGYIYRGKRLPELYGAYIYCDYATGKVWGLRYDEENEKVLWNEEIADSSYSVAAFGLDHQNELYLIAYSGELLQLEPNPAVDRKVTFPNTLSETGLYASVADNKPVPGIVKYEINSPAWHDGADQELWLAVPDNKWIKKADKNGWDFQDGTVALQTLTVETEMGNPESARRIETRMLTRQEGEWLGYSYLWNEEQTEATLVEKKGTKVALQLKDATSPSGNKQHTWHVPSRSECMSCHSRAAKFVLSLSSLQLNRKIKTGEEKVNQIDALTNFFPKPPAKAEAVPEPEVKFVKPKGRPPVLAERPKPRKPAKAQYPAIARKALVDPYDQTADLNLRARSFLHTNCSVCHVKDGGGNARMELEYNTPDLITNIMGVKPLQGTLGIADGLLIAPGEPSRSVMFNRISKLGSGRMPHVGSHHVDTEIRDLFHDWISAMKPDANTPAPSAETLKIQNENHQAIAWLVNSPNAPVDEVKLILEKLLTTTNGAMDLLRVYEQSELSPQMADLVLAYATSEAPATARDLFERFLPEEERVERLGTNFDVAQLLTVPGDSKRGEELFFNTAGISCKNCHKVGDKGGNLGPELIGISKKNTREQLLESILEPSKKIDQQYLGYNVITSEGLVLSGLIVKQNPDDSIVLRDTENKETVIADDDIDDVSPQKKSLMPEQLFRDLTEQQAADLLEYLSSLKDK